VLGSRRGGTGSVRTSRNEDQAAGAGGGAFPGFAAGNTVVGPSVGGAAATAARSDHQHPVLRAANRAALAALDASTMNDGTPCWVSTYGAIFDLMTSALTLDTDTIVAASGAPTKQWIRRQVPYRQNWAAVSWWVDPANSTGTASNENDGVSAVTPLLTWAEFNRRVYYAQWAATVTVRPLSDAATTDDIIVTAIGPANLDIRGVVTVLSTNVVTAAQARTPATNLANEITTAADLSAHVGRLLRVQGTSNYAVCSKAVAAGVLRLGELWNVTTDALAAAAGVANGATVEVMDFTKLPLNIKVQNQVAIRVFDCTIGQGAGSCVIRQLGSEPFALRGARIWAGTIILSHGFAVDNLSAVSIQPTTTFTGVGSQEMTYRACVFLGTSAVFTARKLNFKSTVSQGVPLTIFAPQLVCDGDVGIFDLAAAAVGFDINQDAIGGPVLRWLANRLYGGGNNARSIAIRLTTMARVQMDPAFPPTINTGVGVRLAYLTTSIDVPILQWPFVFNSTLLPSLKFSGAIDTDGAGARISYLADAGAQSGIVNLAAQRYPTSSRLMLLLRVTKLVGAGVVTNNITCTLYKNNIATTMTITVLAADAAGTKYVDNTHPILFADGDDFDLRLDDAADVLGGVLPVSAALEYCV